MTGAPGSLAFRDMTVEDVPSGLRLCRASGWNQTGEDWRFLLTRNPGRFRAAVSGDRVVGTAGAACYGRELAWVCMVLVDPAERGRGVGTRLMEEVLERLGDMSVVGLDATPHGRPVYAKLGFLEGATFVRLQAPPSRTSGRPPAGVRPLAPPDFTAVLARDREIFGADRSELLGWAHERAPGLGWVWDDGGRIEGYCLGRQGHLSDQVGPVVAGRESVGHALVSAVLAGRERGLFIDAVDDGSGWIADLEARGFVRQRPLIRMYRGEPVPLTPPGSYAIFGPEFG